MWVARKFVMKPPIRCRLKGAVSVHAKNTVDMSDEKLLVGLARRKLPGSVGASLVLSRKRGTRRQ